MEKISNFSEVSQDEKHEIYEFLKKNYGYDDEEMFYFWLGKVKFVSGSPGYVGDLYFYVGDGDPAQYCAIIRKDNGQLSELACEQ